MFITETEAAIKSEFPNEYSQIVNELSKKGASPSDIEWGYDFGMRIGGPEPVLNNESDAIEHAKSIYGISIKGSFGKNKKTIFIDNNVHFPTTFVNNAVDNFKNMCAVKNTEKNRIANLDSILKAVGKKGTSEDKNQKMPAVMNGAQMMQFMMQKKVAITYPTISDIRKVRPDIYKKYETLADGSKLVTFAPRHAECDEWGFIIEPVLLVTKRNNELRYVTEKSGMHYIIENGATLFAGALSSIDKAFAAAEGSEFVGWKKTKQYKLTKQEISNEIKGKIFESGGIAF